jgi:multimeric flavodoxin WrbA
MRKNILIISATPRKNGNSDLLCDEFMKGAREAGHTVEKIRLAEKKINYCTGCCSCVGRQGACVQKDDMNDILSRILAADVMVLASPVYFRSFNGQMKTFMDRVCPIYSMIHNKDVYFIASAAGGSLPVESTFQSFRVFTDCLDVQEKGTVSITGLWDAGGVKGTKAMSEAYTMGQRV